MRAQALVASQRAAVEEALPLSALRQPLLPPTATADAAGAARARSWDGAWVGPAAGAYLARKRGETC